MSAFTGGILTVVAAPRWERARIRHDWRNHVPPSVRAVWATLSLEARLCTYETAELIALDGWVRRRSVRSPFRHARHTVSRARGVVHPSPLWDNSA